MIHDFDPYEAMQQLANNQKQLDLNMKSVVMMTNQHTNSLQDHEQRLDLNQQTINQILASLQNQQKLIMALFDQLTQSQAVNNSKDSNNDQTSSGSQG